MKRINIILAVLVVIVASACGSRRDRCPSVGDNDTTLEQVDNAAV
jgi:hypothetical protein